MKRFVLILAVVALAPGLARADDAEDPAYLAGRKAYDLGDFDRAIAEWRKGFEATSHPAYLFNIGSAYRAKHDYERAIFFYQAFLREAPRSPRRDLVERRIEDMK